MSAVTSSGIAFLGTLMSAIWSLVLQYILAKKCHVPGVLSDYSTKFQCTREQAACMVLPVIVRGDEGKRRQTCVETVCSSLSESIYISR
jgi:hypothetical protein